MENPIIKHTRGDRMKEKIKKTKKEPEKTLKKTEVNEKVDLIEELESKKQELADRQCRIKGGTHPRLGREIAPIDKEIEKREKIIRMREIEIERDAPNEAMTKYNYENNEEWRGLRRWFMKEELEGMKKQLEAVKEQKKTCEEDIPRLKEEIAKLEKKAKK